MMKSAAQHDGERWTLPGYLFKVLGSDL